MPGASAYIGLAAPGEAGSWQQDGTVLVLSKLLNLTVTTRELLVLNLIVFQYWISTRVTGSGRGLIIVVGSLWTKMSERVPIIVCLGTRLGRRL